MRRRFNPRQPRDWHGRWTKSRSTKVAGKVKSSTAKKTTVSRIVGSSPGVGTGSAVGKEFVHKEGVKDWTAQTPTRKKAPKTPSQHQAARGLVNTVPYARVSPKSVSAGVNVGAALGKNHRIVAGTFVRIERNNLSGKEKDVQKLLANDPLAKAALDKVLGKSVKLPKGASARIGTSSTGLPSITVRKGTHSVSVDKSARAMTEFNNAMAKKVTGKKVKKSRPQRRKKNSG